MAKEQKSADQPSGAAEQAMAQARSAADIYFEYVKQAISATPSGGNEFTERIKECAEKNITMTQEYLKHLSQARNFQDMVRVQTEFMQSMMNAAGEQTRSWQKHTPKQQRIRRRSQCQACRDHVNSFFRRATFRRFCFASLETI
jgi:hypothetical protein